MAEVGTKDNFFDIGGHSLLIIDVMRRINNDSELKRKLSMVDLYRHTTIEAIAALFDSDTQGSVPVNNKGASRASSRRAARSRKRQPNTLSG